MDRQVSGDARRDMSHTAGASSVVAAGAAMRDPVRVTKRGGRRVIEIDFRYRDELNRRQRFRQHAKATTVAAARAEARRLIDAAAATGSPISIDESETFSAFVVRVYRV